MADKTHVYHGVHVDVFTKVTLKGTRARNTLHLSVPSKYVGTAAERNKIKRWCREMWRKSSFKTRAPCTEVHLHRPQKTTFQSLVIDFREADRHYATLLSSE